MGANVFEKFCPEPAHGPPFFDASLNAHHCLRHTVHPSQEANQQAARALKWYGQQHLNAVDSAGVPRSDELRLAKGMMGVWVERWVRARILEFCSQIDGMECKLEAAGPAISAAGEFEQVDVLLEKWRGKGSSVNSVRLKIEIRSSFNYYSVRNAIFRTFSVLGPYGNGVKPGETVKDVYLFVLVDLHQRAAGAKCIVYADPAHKTIDYAKTAAQVLLQHTLAIGPGSVEVKNPFDLILVGGATRDMFADPALTQPLKSNSSYRNPEFQSIAIPKALDACGILKRILAI